MAAVQQRPRRQRGPQRARRTAVILAIAVGLAAFGVTALLLRSTADRVTYYVLGRDVAQRGAITPDMLVAREVNRDGVPPNALSRDFVAHAQPMYAAVALKTGDVLTASTTGRLPKLTSGLPAGTLVASVEVRAADAVGAAITVGDEVEVAAVGTPPGGQGATATIVLHRIRVLDIRSGGGTTGGLPQALPGGSSANRAAAGSSTSSIYTVAVSPEQFARLAVVADQRIQLALSPAGDGAVPDATVRLEQLLTGTVR